jgi:hypothetical protein
MAPAAGFPRELLGHPPHARLAYFVGKVVAHPRLMEVHQALMRAIQQPAGASLILVVGPTGVGKTTLRQRVEQQLLEAALPDLAQDPGRVPVVGLEAVAAEAGPFNWKDYYTRALRALDEPLIARKIAAPHGPPGSGREGAGGVGAGRAAAPELRRALEQCLRQRRPAAVIVDEAQHLTKMASGRRLLDQMDVLKSLAALTGTVHVLIGTYELVGLATLSGQLSRRSHEIHFGRYRAEAPEELRAFQSVLLTFQRYLPLAREPDLVGRSAYLYERSVGCIGVLKGWLNRALAAALEEGAATVTAQHLERQAEPARKLLSLAREIQEGEEALAAGGQEHAELRRCLGLAPEPCPGETTASETAATAHGAHPEPRRRGARVGERRPARDPVGVGGAAHVS